MGKKKLNVPDIPPRLAVPIVDNHTHIYPDPQAADGERLAGAQGAAGRESLVGKEKLADIQDLGSGERPQPDSVSSTVQQLLTDDGKWRFPVLENNLISGMERAGIRAAITSGCEIPELESTLALAHRRSGTIFAALAIHPNEAVLHAGVRDVGPDGLAPQPQAWHEEFSLAAAIERVADMARDSAVLAVGETGLDYFRTGDSGKEAQKEAFRAHIALAKELNKPMQIHDRDAHADVVEILLTQGAPERTVFHCFSGDAELAAICAEHGWYASFAGPITYHANHALREAFMAMPPELILVETDAPYLTPMPFRGHPNVPWGAAYTARFMAWLRFDAQAANVLAQGTAAQVQAAAEGVSDDLVDRWCEQLGANTRAVYGI
ncbi:MAG: TatD family hydrolase [Actinomycetaceae bacterium]|nr:TatD family hydrolase [Arcanobacterium sp.]MDD7687404.1 TatD family hydrolase [Actinomycetaceae bacterium]MDY5272878.1 TatD family hydrolase [Arcanobacterium sp.]